MRGAAATVMITDFSRCFFILPLIFIAAADYLHYAALIA